MNVTNPDPFIRLPELLFVTRLSESTIRRLERTGEFPQRRRITSNTVGWVRAEVENWLATRPTVNSNSSGNDAA